MRVAACIASLLVLLVLQPQAAHAQRRPRPEQRDGIAMHYEDTDIAVIVDAVARATGRRVVYGDELRGRVTITVPGRVSGDEAFELLLAALYQRGFTALALEDGTLRIVPVLETAGAAPLATGPLSAEGERPVTTLVELDELSAQDAYLAIQPYVSPNAIAIPLETGNRLILAATESQLVRLVAIVRALDAVAGEALLVRTIRYRETGAIADMIDVVFNSGPVASEHVELFTDDARQQIVVRGHPLRLAEVRRFVERMDRPLEGQGLVRVVRVRNRDAEELAGMLATLAESRPVGGGAPPVGFEGGAEGEGFVPDLGGALVGRSFHIEVDAATRSLLVSADAETFEILARAIAELDRLPPRIVVDVLLFEVTRPAGLKLGINYSAFASADDEILMRFESVGGLVTEPSGDAVAFGRYVAGPVILLASPLGGEPVPIRVPLQNATIEAGEVSMETNVLLRPHIVGVSGDEHQLFAGDNIPVPTASAPAAAPLEGATDVPVAVTDPLNITQNIERVDVGVDLRIEPKLGEAGDVRLALALEVSDVVPSVAGDPEVVGPTFAKRTLETTLDLRPGRKAVLGATGAEATAERTVGVPFLKDIPFLGWFFRTVEKRADKTDLILVIEARVLKDADAAAVESIRRRLAFERSISRSADLNSTGAAPFAVLLDSLGSESAAKTVAEAFAEDGFPTRIIPWDGSGGRFFDVYLTDLVSFGEAGELARRLSDAGWSPEIAVLSPVNELAED